MSSAGALGASAGAPTNLLSGIELEKSVAIAHGFSSSACK
jgi:hypothetical protein